MLAEIQREWHNNPRYPGWSSLVSSPRKVGEYFFGSRLIPNLDKWRIEVAGRWHLEQDKPIGHVITAELSEYPSRDKLNVLVAEMEEKLAAFFREVAVGLMREGVIVGDEDG